MRIRRAASFYMTVGAIAFGVVEGAAAGTISSVTKFATPGFSTGSAGPVGSTPAPNNDDVTGNSPNLIPFSVFFNSPGFLETEFGLADSGGTTEYRFTQTFFNNTDMDWAGFRFELGFGTGSNFVVSQVADALQFDSFEGHSTATSNAFTLTLDEMKTLGWGGANVTRFRAASFTFAIDVPDGLATANSGGLNRFTLRQTPIGPGAAVPEPATFGLAGVALMACGFAARRERK